MSKVEQLKDELAKVAGQSGPYNDFDQQQSDFVKVAVADFLADLAKAFANLKDEPS